MRAIIYQFDDAPITMEDVEDVTVDGEDVAIRNFEGLQQFNINDVQEVRLVA